MEKKERMQSYKSLSADAVSLASLKWIPWSYLEAHHQRSHMHNGFITAVYNPVPFNTTLNTKWCGKNKSNYSAIQHQTPCLQRGLHRNKQDDAPRLETNPRFLFSYTLRFTLIIWQYRGKQKKDILHKPHKMQKVWHIWTFILDNGWERQRKW